MSIVDIQHVSKSFGSKQVLNDVSIKIEEGRIFGLIGQNGAGKTTLMKIMLGLLKKDAGDISLVGEKVQFGQTVTNQAIGYLPDVPSFYPYYTAYEYLLLCGEITGLSKKERELRAKETLTQAGLEKNNKKISSFSRGMKQRLGIAQALIHKPKILICDEPTSALDPNGRRDILKILQKIKHETTVIFSTHLLNDAENICDDLAILHNGSFVISGDVQQLLNERRKSTLFIEAPVQTLEKLKEAFPEATDKNHGIALHSTSIEETQSTLFQYCLDHQLVIHSMSIEKTTLDDLFMEVTAK